MPRIEVTEDCREALKEWREAEQESYSEVILTALEARARWPSQESALYAVTDAAKALQSEAQKLRGLRLGERVSQMENIGWETKAYMEILAKGIVKLLHKRWWAPWR